MTTLLDILEEVKSSYSILEFNIIQLQKENLKLKKKIKKLKKEINEFLDKHNKTYEEK